MATLRRVLVQRPGARFGEAFEDRRNGFRHEVDLGRARDEHAGFVDLLASLGCEVSVLEDGTMGPDFVYQYDPSLVVDRGAILLRSGKPTRRGEEDVHGRWYDERHIPIVGAIEPPGTVDGGDVCWLAPGELAVGRTLRTNQAGIEQMRELVTEVVHVFDMPYDRGPDECLHLMSVISPVAEDVAAVELARLPVGLYDRCRELGIGLVEVPPEEVPTLGCNVLAVAPRTAVMLEGNPITQRRLEERDVDVHTFEGDEICLNGSGGPTCLTRPILRA